MACATGGLSRAEAAINNLVRNLHRLQRSRPRYSESPEPYSPGESTPPYSPNQLIDERERLEKLERDLIAEHGRSSAPEQFRTLFREMCVQAVLGDAAVDDPNHVPPPSLAAQSKISQNIRQLWMRQGIWRDGWNVHPPERWAHEDPGTTPDQELHPVLGVGPATPQSEKDRAAWQQREASRPYHQFIYQVSMECKAILDRLDRAKRASAGPDAQGVAIVVSADMSTTAYETVKKRWIKRGIWERAWGILPGMCWNHEEPLENFLRRRMGDDYYPSLALRLPRVEPPFADGQQQADAFPQQKREPLDDAAVSQSGPGPVTRSKARSDARHPPANLESGPSCPPLPVLEPPAVANEALTGSVGPRRSGRVRRAATSPVPVPLPNRLPPLGRKREAEAHGASPAHEGTEDKSPAAKRRRNK